MRVVVAMTFLPGIISYFEPLGPCDCSPAHRIARRICDRSMSLQKRAIEQLPAGSRLDGTCPSIWRSRAETLQP